VIWLKVVGVVLVVLACDVAVGAGALIAVSLLSTARHLVLWIGVGSLGFGLLSAAAGVLFVNRAYKWDGDSPWRSLMEASQWTAARLQTGDIPSAMARSIEAPGDPTGTKADTPANDGGLQ